MKHWYVVQVFAGYEEQVKKDIERRIPQEGLEDLIGQVLIPSAKLKQYFTAPDAEDQQLFPGYMLVEIEPVPEAIRAVVSTPRVLKFLGGKDPVPLSQKEVDKIMKKMHGEIVVAPGVPEFIEGKEVEIADGPFSGFVGIVEKVDKDAERLIVMVSIFGRMTPVELGFSQVKR